MEEKKEKKTFWLYPSVKEKINFFMKDANCSSASEFVEKAINFYCGYLTTCADSEYLPKVMLGAIDGSVKMQSTSLNRNLFKIAVELDMLSNLLAATIDVTPEELTRARASAVDRVKHINGVVGIEAAYKNQNGDAV